MILLILAMPMITLPLRHDQKEILLLKYMNCFSINFSNGFKINVII